jgi:hypothetical protein
MAALAFTGKDRRQQASDLAGIWDRISSQHLSGGQGCGCSFGGLMFQATDFELDIVEFVIGEAKKAGLPKAELYIDEIAKRGPDRYSLLKLLRALEQGDYRMASEPEIDVVLTSLNTTLSAIEQAHSKGRFVCD